ncbi:hypothetical protein BVRB_028350 [Beta vulgaris subsp. vulgaris]|uniref:14-3-3 domain-containing protein n=1 Tax=Beta vulgaris subsp. vulgaris TaxID=3555 RepID=A0A0J8AY37_BETVV|nr:hypothetical protein BVRB_028350 [Beta vulgaris subsp. vulgaris]
MADIMKRLVLSKVEPLNDEERAIFAIAFKNVSGERRAAWRKIYSIERQETDRLDSSGQTMGDGDKDQQQPSMHRLALIRQYKSHIENELTFICTQVGDLMSFDCL